ncbi:hypothetical protein YC2023_089110 [Brassica napus]
MPTAGAKPAHARHVLGWTSVSSPSYPAGSRKPYSLDREDSDERGHVLWLSITRRCNVVVTRRTVGCRTVTRRTVGRGRLKVPSSGLCGLWNPRVSVASIYGVTSKIESLVALGKDDRIAWCWTLGPPV